MTATLPEVDLDIDYSLDVPCTTIPCEAPALWMVTFGCDPNHQAPYCDVHLARIRQISDNPTIRESLICEPHGDRHPYPIAGWRPL